MKKILLSLLLAFSFTANAQFWTEKATGFAAAGRTLNSISIVDANVIWANAYDNSNPAAQNFTIQEFTRSTDGGNTWMPGTMNLGAGTAGLGVSSIMGLNATTAWISASPDVSGLGGVWKTTDSGTTWTQQTTALYSSVSSFTNLVYFWDANNGVAQGDPESNEFEIYTTTDGGTNWTRVAGANIPDPSPIGGEFGYSNRYSVSGNTIWFGTSSGRIFKSIDKGFNWTVATSPSIDFALDKFTFSDSTKGLLMIYDNTSPTLYSTIDGGANWVLVTTAMPAATDIAYIPGTSTVVSGNSAGTVGLGSRYSLDNGVTWINIDTVPHGTLAFLNSSLGFSANLNTSPTVGGIFKFSGIPLSAPSFEGKKNISAYPNPTNGFMQINSEKSLIKEITIFDLLGKQVYNSKFTALSKVNLDLKSLSNGVYFLRVTSDAGNTETMKIIKN